MGMNLIEGIQGQCERLRSELIPQYEEIGAPGIFGILLMRAAIKQSETAIAEHDVIKMLAAYKQLKEFE